MKSKQIKYSPSYIIKANRLIGEFMGFKFIDDYSFQKTPNGHVYDRGVLRILVRKLGKLEFEKNSRITKQK